MKRDKGSLVTDCNPVAKHAWKTNKTVVEQDKKKETRKKGSYLDEELEEDHDQG